MKRERSEIGKGFEHHVYLADAATPTVLKVPNTLTTIFTCFAKSRADLAREEFTRASQNYRDSEVIIPKTRIFPIKNSYVIAQEFIREDLSVDKASFFANTSEELKTNYQLHPTNFISQNGVVFLIDPSRGFITKFLEDHKLLKKTDYWKCKLGVKKVVEKLKSSSLRDN